MSLQNHLNSIHAISRRGFIKQLGAGLMAAVFAGLDSRGAFAQGPTTGLAAWSMVDFTSLVGQKFTVSVRANTKVTFTLAKVTGGTSIVYHGPKRMANAPAGQSFALVFYGPRTPALSQKVYSFTHSKLGQFSLFIIPVKADQNGQHYEAIVNHMHA